MLSSLFLLYLFLPYPSRTYHSSVSTTLLYISIYQPKTTWFNKVLNSSLFHVYLSTPIDYKVLKDRDRVFAFFYVFYSSYPNIEPIADTQKALIDWIVNRPWFLSSLLQVCGKPTPYHSGRLYKYHGWACWSGGRKAQSAVPGLHWPQTGVPVILGTLYSNPVSSTGSWKVG